MNIRDDPDYDLYISYTGEDAEWVESLMVFLQQRITAHIGRPTKIFNDTGLSAGVEFEAERVLGRSRLLLCIVSRAYFESEWCRYELSAFLGNHGMSKVVPILLQSEIPRSRAAEEIWDLLSRFKQIRFFLHTDGREALLHPGQPEWLQQAELLAEGISFTLSRPFEGGTPAGSWREESPSINDIQKKAPSIDEFPESGQNDAGLGGLKQDPERETPLGKLEVNIAWLFFLVLLLSPHIFDAFFG
ncbi:MAG: toll/interleukin-1 receptor domain-containing protein [Vulcanimicrobiota bacterium]